MSDRFPVGDAFVLVGAGDGRRLHCAECDHDFGPHTEDPKLSAVVAERALGELTELNRIGTLDEIILREFYCPECGALIAANVQRRTDPVMVETRLA